MPALPDGEPIGAEGPLTPQARARVGRAPFGLYLHVPFCRVRCGYCDFNTYTAAELAGSTGETDYLAAIRREVRMAVGALGPGRRPAETVFIGGGTPTLLGAAALGGLLGELRAQFGLAEGVEVTVEANPDSVDLGDLQALAEAGVTRVSFGVQSVVPTVLAALDRTHDPEAVPVVLDAARSAGLQTSVDLIYGAPGETAADWERTVRTAVGWRPDHLSAYALVVEPGTRLAGQVRRGEVAAPDDDDLADRYETADRLLTAAGYGWYEVSNFARSADFRCRHNLGYWAGHDWWGLGPGAHSHVGGVRWWNVKHPAAYAAALAGGRWPVAGRERLTDEQSRVEEVLLGIRVVDGLPVDDRERLNRLAAEGLLDARSATAGRAVLTLRGRLLADHVARTLLA